MFCPQCGSESQPAAQFCQKCGNALSTAAENSNANAHSQAGQAAIWNPNAAVNWSLVFTPAFGAYLQMLNWRALGESDKAKSAENWFHAGVGVLFVYLLIGAVIGDQIGRAHV